MFANERMNLTCEMLKRSGAVTTAQISSDLNVSVETVRRDLLTLEREHKLVRVHGGAVSIGGAVMNSPLSDRLELNLDKKKSLSKATCRFINENDVVTIDEGSTGLELAKVLVSCFNNLTVITHSLDIFNVVIQKDGFEVILIGGRFLKGENSFCGYLAENSFKSLHLGKVFITPSAISLKSGLCNTDEQTVPLQRIIASRADSVFILADSDKFEKSALYTTLPLDTSYTYITDSDMSDELIKLYGENGYRIVRE